MRIGVIGVGGIGGVMAACLTRSGATVTAVARDPMARERIAAHGYEVTDNDGARWQVAASAPPVAVLPDALKEDARPFDAVVLTTQAPALEEALGAARSAFAPHTTLLVLQNGLPEARAEKVLPGVRVLGAVVGWGASMVGPGVYKRTSGGGLQIGQMTPLDPTTRATLGPLLETLKAQGPVELAENFAGVRWSKLAINSVTSTLGAVGGEALGALLVHRKVRRLALEIFGEVEAVARASGVRMAPVGGTLDISRVTLTDGERRARFGTPSLVGKHLLLLAVGAKFRKMRSSMLYALERKRPPEIDFLNGELVRRGAALGVPTPVNAALVDRVREIERGQQRSSVRGLIELATRLT